MNKNIIVALGIFIAGFLTAKYYSKPETKIEVKEKVVTRTVIKRVVAKDGTETTETIIDTDTNRSSKTTPGPKLNVSALIANDFSSTMIPLYGVSVSKEFIGPITLGAFGLTNGVIGLSIGMNF